MYCNFCCGCIYGIPYFFILAVRLMSFGPNSILVLSILMFALLARYSTSSKILSFQRYKLLLPRCCPSPCARRTDPARSPRPFGRQYFDLLRMGAASARRKSILLDSISTRVNCTRTRSERRNRLPLRSPTMACDFSSKWK